MQALLDNDLLYKLTRYGILDDFEALLLSKGFSAPHGRLASAPWSMKARKNPPDPSLWPQLAEAIAFTAFCFERCVATTGVKAANLSALDVPSFDDGEIALVAYALEHPAAAVFTGDKRAIKAVANHPKLSSVYTQMSGRFVHLEMVMATLSVQLGWALVCTAVQAASSVDAVLREAFGRSTEAQGRAVLNDSINRLRSESRMLLFASF